MRRAVALGAGLVAFAASSPGHADTPPNLWELARDPVARARWDLHVRVERLMPPYAEANPDAELRLEAARGLLEDAGIDGSRGQDVRLRLDLGTVYERLARSQHRADLHAKAADILAPAIDEAPDGDGATSALSELVYAYVRLGRPREELAAWRRYIAQLVDDRARIVPLINMGEAEMRLGLLDDALATFRQAIRLCEELSGSTPVNSTYALALWDLAVAQDRASDSGTAVKTAARARAWTWSEVVTYGQRMTTRTVSGWDVIRDDEDVFFVPEWERDWYLALGYAAEARASADPREAARSWGEAERHWDTYVTRSAATDGHDPWLAIARVRRDRARAAREAAERLAARSRVPAGLP